MCLSPLLGHLFSAPQLLLACTCTKHKTVWFFYLKFCVGLFELFWNRGCSTSHSTTLSSAHLWVLNLCAQCLECAHSSSAFLGRWWVSCQHISAPCVEQFFLQRGQLTLHFPQGTRSWPQSAQMAPPFFVPQALCLFLSLKCSTVQNISGWTSPARQNFIYQ